MSSASSLMVPRASPTHSALAVIEFIIGQLPQCVQVAGFQAATTNNCNGDVACNCQDDTFLSLMEDVIEKNCSAADGQEALTLAKMFCTAEIPSLNDNQNTLIIGLYTVLLFLSVTSVSLRFLARRIAGTKLWYDDYLIVISLVLTCGLTTDGLVGLSIGFGHHILTLSYNQDINFGKMWWAGQFIFVNAVTAIKISILFFYLRIFPSRRFKLATMIVGAMQATWWISFLGALTFSCSPVRYFWIKTIPGGYCGNTIAMLYAATGTGFIADFLVWCLPITSLWGLQVPPARRLAIIAIFLLGGFVCLSALVRFPMLSRINQVDKMWTVVDAGIWIVVECNIGIVCACIPVLGPCFKAISSTPTITFLRSRASRFNKTSSISGSSNTAADEKPLPPPLEKSFDEESAALPSSRDEEGAGFEIHERSLDLSASTEKIVRLGHLWELDDRVLMGKKGHRR